LTAHDVHSDGAADSAISAVLPQLNNLHLLLSSAKPTELRSLHALFGIAEGRHPRHMKGTRSELEEAVEGRYVEGKRGKGK
jgi:hypothetical protein